MPVARPLLPMPLLACVAALGVTTPVLAQTVRKVTRLADGVYAIEHQDAGDGYASGNTTVIIGDRQAFVVDAGFLPSTAREDIAQIRRWTDKPIAFLLDTHFHNDHNFGNRAYLDAFPALTIVAQVETKKDMDRFGPGSAARAKAYSRSLRQMLDRGGTKDGPTLTAAERAEVQHALARQRAALAELEPVTFQSATLTFDHDFTVDLGHREVQVKFLGRGNTAGDAVVFLPGERIAVAGDLVVHPMPYVDDGYPSEWGRTLRSLLALSPETIVPGHGPVLHGTEYLLLLRDLFESVVGQLDVRLAQVGPAMGHTVDEVKGGVDLTPFRPRFAGADSSLGRAFDAMAASLVELAFKEASLR